jgi:hypothetical protein
VISHRRASFLAQGNGAFFFAIVYDTYFSNSIMASYQTVLVWFRNDLRVRDNETLVRATERASQFTFLMSGSSALRNLASKKQARSERNSCLKASPI